MSENDFQDILEDLKPALDAAAMDFAASSYPGRLLGEGDQYPASVRVKLASVRDGRPVWLTYTDPPELHYTPEPIPIVLEQWDHPDKRRYAILEFRECFHGTTRHFHILTSAEEI